MWEVVGYQMQLDENGKPKGCTLFVTKPMRDKVGVGSQAKRFWYRPDELTYQPAVGDRVHIDIEVRGKYESVTDIYF